MSFISDVFGRTRRNNGTSGQNAQSGTTSSQPTQPLNRNNSGQGNTPGSAQGSQGTTTAPTTQPQQGQGTAQPGTGQVRTGAAAAAAANNPAAQQNHPQPQASTQGSQGHQGATTTPTIQPQGQQGLATAQPVQAYPVAQPTLGDTGLAQRLVAQALQGNTVYFGVLPDGRGGYAYQGFGSELELQAAVQSYSGQLAAQQAAGFSTGNFADEAVIHAEFTILMDQLGRGIAAPETEHLRVVRIWEDAGTGAQYASPANIPANARNVRMRLAVTQKGANARILGYL